MANGKRQKINFSHIERTVEALEIEDIRRYIHDVIKIKLHLFLREVIVLLKLFIFH